jgi:biopolymer transport protein ExbD
VAFNPSNGSGGRGRGNSGRRDAVEINVTPFVDVLRCCFIFC